MSSVIILCSDFGRKWCSTAFYRHEMEAEVRERGWVAALFPAFNGFDELMPPIGRLYASEGFQHVDTARCLAYKCSYFYTADGIWTIRFRHCAANVKVF